MISRKQAIGRRRVALGGLALVLALGAGLIWTRRDPLPVRAVIRPQGWFWEAGFGHDGRSYLVQVRGGLVRHDAATGRAIGFIPLDCKLAAQGWSEDEGGRTATAIASAPDDTSSLLKVDAATGAVRARFAGSPGRQLCCVRPADGGRALASVLIGGGKAPEAITWDVATGATTRRAVGMPRFPIGGTADGRTWAYLDPARDGVLLWDAAADRPLGPAQRDPADPAATGGCAPFGADGRSLAVARADGRIEFWDFPAARLLRTVAAHRAGFAPTFGLFSPDGRLLISLAQRTGPDWRSRGLDRYNGLVPPNWRVYDNHETVVLDVDAGAVVARWPGVMYPPQFSPDGRTLAVQEPDGTFSLRDVPARPRP